MPKFQVVGFEIGLQTVQFWIILATSIDYWAQEPTGGAKCHPTFANFTLFLAYSVSQQAISPISGVEGGPMGHKSTRLNLESTSGLSPWSIKLIFKRKVGCRRTN
jgi:hypothetical protein